jgi:transposase
MCAQNTTAPNRFIALDIHKYYFVAVGVDPHLDQILGPQRVKIINLQKWCQQQITSSDAVVIEMTTNTWEVYDQLVCYAGAVTVVHPPHAAAVTKSKVKTDRKAALTLARLHAAGLLEGIWIPPKPVRDMRALIARRSKMVGLATQAKNRLHAVLHRYAFPLPDNPIFSPEQKDWWFSLPLSKLEHVCVQTDLNTLDFVQQQLDEIDHVLKEQAAQEERLLFLVQLPGCRWLTGMTILAAIGDISRFSTAKKLVGYSGLGASVHISGKTSRTGKITKQGRRDLRTAMIRIAHAAAKSHPHWKAELSRLEPRLGYQKAIVAIARKLLIVVWHVLSHSQVDRYAIDQQLARKLLQHSYDLGKRLRPGTAAAHVRQMLNQLGRGHELTHIRWSPSQMVPLPPA